jgi:subtilisin family serine protease
MLDDPSGPRYQYPNTSYLLPNLHAGQPFGVARDSEVVVAVADTGSFQDPRSLDEWWQIRPGFTRHPVDAYYTNQWALERLRAPQAWAQSTGADIVIAVIDTGVDLDHPDLMSKVLTDLDKDFVNDDSAAADDHGHGTHVAGIAAAATDNGLGIAGLGWDVKILPLKVLDAEGNGDGANLAAAIHYAADIGVEVINMSLGGAVPCGWPVDEAANDAHSRGVTLIAAAGNHLGDTEMFPANCEHVLGVAATDQADAVAYYSNYGSHVSVAAPGSGIYSTLNGGSYGYDSGTSMAAPHAAGLAALLVARYPSYTPDRVASAILDTARDLGAPGWDEHYGCGRIDASLALATGALDAEPICLQAVGPWEATSPIALEDASYVPGEIIAQLRPGVRASSILGSHAAGAQYLPGLEAWRLSVPQGQEQAVLAELGSDPDVIRAGLNYLVSAQ